VVIVTGSRLGFFFCSPLHSISMVAGAPHIGWQGVVWGLVMVWGVSVDSNWYCGDFSFMSLTVNCFNVFFLCIMVSLFLLYTTLGAGTAGNEQ